MTIPFFDRISLVLLRAQSTALIHVAATPTKVNRLGRDSLPVPRALTSAPLTTEPSLFPILDTRDSFRKSGRHVPGKTDILT